MGRAGRRRRLPQAVPAVPAQDRDDLGWPAGGPHQVCGSGADHAGAARHHERSDGGGPRPGGANPWRGGTRGVRPASSGCRMTRAAVFGAGLWGTTFAKVLADAGGDVTLWARREEQADAISRTHRNEAYLAGIDLPATLQ